MTATPDRPLTTGARVGPADPGGVTGDRAIQALRPLGFDDARIDGGFWGRRQQVNRHTTIPSGWANLERTGNLANLELAATITDGGAKDRFRNKWFADSDVAKWLEAVSWESGRGSSAEFDEWSRRAVELVAAAQMDDGYLNSYVQLVLGQAMRWGDLPYGHELYCMGHLIQGAVARYRGTGRTDLLDVAVRIAELLADSFGRAEPGRVDGVDGHPEIETALVELARATGRADILATARYFVEAHGRGLTDPTGIRSAYYADLVPPREARTVYGHAVRAVYLQAGVADLAVETGDTELLDASRAAWDSMVGEKSYLTGAIGSRWAGEAFGAPWELGPDRAYGETCAAQGVVQWGWRLLLATGDARHADHIERTLFNGFAPGTNLTGDRFFYVNTLQLRGGTIGEDERDPVNGRQGWFDCACCPPSVMRTTSVLHAYLATWTTDGLQVHQYAPGTLAAELAGGRLEVAVETAYPLDGRVVLRVLASPDGPVELSVRVPSWCPDATLTVDGRPADVPADPGTYARVSGALPVGTEVVLELPMPVRAVLADDRVDAIRGQYALTRGPLVYCFEQVDQPEGLAVDEMRLRLGLVPGTGLAEPGPSAGPGGGVVTDAQVVPRPDLLDGTVTVSVPAASRTDPRPVRAVALPYAVWANREVGPMRIWTPPADATSQPSPERWGDSRGS